MFNLKRFKIVKDLKNISDKTGLLRFSEIQNNENKTELIDSIISECNFVKEDKKLRLMAEEMLEKEFPEIKEMKDYDFFVDMVVNKLKQQQVGDMSDIEEE